MRAARVGSGSREVWRSGPEADWSHRCACRQLHHAGNAVTKVKSSVVPVSLLQQHLISAQISAVSEFGLVAPSFTHTSASVLKR